MSSYIKELYGLSEAGNKDAQIILVFKMVYEFDQGDKAREMCSKWLNISPIFEALFEFLCIISTTSDEDIETRTRAFNKFKSMSTLADNTVETHHSWYMLGRYYHKGFIFDEDIATALKWYEKAAERGNDLANFELGEYYLSLQKV